MQNVSLIESTAELTDIYKADDMVEAMDNIYTYILALSMFILLFIHQ